MDTPHILRIGKVSSINYPKGTARVTYEDKSKSTTTEFSFLAWEYWMPKEGDQVVVGHFSNGTTSAVILGPVWHDDHRPIEGFKGLYRKEYYHQQGKAYERYDAEKKEEFDQFVTGQTVIEATKKWTVKVGPCSIEVDVGGTITITAPSGVEVVTPLAHFTGDIKTDGDVVANGVSLQHHTHQGATPPNV